MAAYAHTFGATANALEKTQTGVTSADTLVFTIPRVYKGARLSVTGTAITYRRGAAPSGANSAPLADGGSVSITPPQGEGSGAWAIHCTVASGTASVTCEALVELVGSADNSAAVAADLTAHEAAADPHPGYLLEGTQRDVSAASVTQVVADFQSFVSFDTTAGDRTYDLLALGSLDRTKCKYVDVANETGANNVILDGNGADTLRSGGVTAGTLSLPPGATARLWVPASGTIWRVP